MDGVVLLAGIVLLAIGADRVVYAAQAISTRFRISPVIVGLTVVALATSLPEALVSVVGVWQERGDLALSNAVGSNMFNILFILGIVAIFRPLSVDRRFLSRELPVLAMVTGGCIVFAIDHRLTRPEGLLLLVGLIVYLALLVRTGHRSGERHRGPTVASTVPIRPALISLALGFGLLATGAHLAMTAALSIAETLSLSQGFVGLFVLGAGSSLPELITSYVAVRKGSGELAVGNILGSCLFNLLFVVGLATLVAPTVVALSGAIQLDLVLMAGAFMVAAWFLRSGFRVTRLEGVVLVANYFLYVALAWALHHSPVV